MHGFSNQTFLRIHKRDDDRNCYMCHIKELYKFHLLNKYTSVSVAGVDFVSFSSGDTYTGDLRLSRARSLTDLEKHEQYTISLTHTIHYNVDCLVSRIPIIHYNVACPYSVLLLYTTRLNHINSFNQ